MNIDKAEARQAFEKWAKGRGMYAHRREGEYPDSAARFAWDVWIAAWTEAQQPASQPTMPAPDLYKVVRTDNYARETVAERLVAEKLDLSDAQVICERLQNGNRSYDDWYVVKPQAAKLWRGMEEFI